MDHLVRSQGGETVSAEGVLARYNEYSAEGCTHPAEKVLYFEIPSGTVMVLVCTDEWCNHATLYCEHSKNSWNEDKTQLTCDLCGADGT
jgi:hypothetical protein